MAYSNWYKCIKLKYIIFGFLVLPFAFNWILNLNCGFFNVIGGKAAPVVWLQFWGTYLAAVAAFCVIFQNEKQKLQAEDKECKRRIVNYIVHQVGNNIYLKFKAIFDEISEYRNSQKSKWDSCDFKVSNINVQLDNLETEIRLLEIEWRSIFYNEEAEELNQYAENLLALLAATIGLICESKKYLKGDETDLSQRDVENLQRKSQKLHESAVAFLSKINGKKVLK